MRNRFGKRTEARLGGQTAASLALLTLVSLPLSAGTRQTAQQQQPTTPSYNRPVSPGFPDMSAGPATNPARLEKMREDERRKRLLSDTAKLVELSNELKVQVDKASRDELSLDVVRKAAEIEKLARDVKERMKS